MYNTIAVTVENGVQIIRMNRPEKRNAINHDMFKEIPDALKAGASDSNVVVTVLTGVGNFYSSGNDQSNFLTWNFGSDTEQSVRTATAIVQEFVQTIIDFPKILIAVVNGPSVGLPTTTLPLFDLVYCSTSAYFITPFVALGLTPEGCSSYTFPQIMGSQRAAQMLQFGKKLTAAEALDWGFVAELYTAEQQNDIWSKIHSIAQLPSKSLIFTKNLLRSQNQNALNEANRIECERLVERFQSEDSHNAIVKFFSAKKSKM